MTEKEILELRDLAEVGKVQFKERIVDNYDIACEMCALSNYKGGRIIIGINDKTGAVNPLSFKETQETTQTLGNIASSGLKRAMDTGIDVQFNDNEKTKEFVVTIPRKEHHVNAPSNQGVHHDTNEGPAKSNHGGPKSNEGLTKSNHSEVTKVTKPSITKKQLDIVNFCSVPRTAKEIMDRLGITNQTKNRQHYITELVEKGYLELTIPENPTHMNQKYRRTQISYKE